MLTVIGLSLFVIIFLVFLGGPISLVILQKFSQNYSLDFVTFLSFSILIGFGISGLISSWAYGVFGINKYPLIALISGILMWLVAIFKFKLNGFSILKFKKINFLILAPLALSIYLAKTQWSGWFKPRIYSGYGPDVGQNLMAAQSANSIGATWGQASKNLQQVLGVSNMHQAGLDLFRAPNFHEVAGFDYLVFGGRWGLTVPANQIMRFFGPQAVLWEIGFVLVTTLTCLAIITYSFSKIITNSKILATTISLISMSNAALLQQYFNGGLSQIFGLIGVYGILLVLLLLINYNNSNAPDQKHGFKLSYFIISFFSWVGSSVTYVDQTFIVILLLLIVLLLFSFINKLIAKDIIQNIVLAGFLAVAVNPPFVRLIISGLDLRITANSGTGASSGFWKPPSQFWGIFDMFTNPSSTQTKLLLIISIAISMLTLVVFILSIFKEEKNRYMSLLGLAGLIVTGIGFLISQNSKGQSDYIYSKVSLYMAPFIVIPLILVLYNSASRKKLRQSIVYVVLTINVFSVISYENNFSKNPEVTIVPNEYSTVLENKEIKKYLLRNNYLMPYKPSYNFAALFGAEYWISKSPNDMNLSSRLSNELRLFCFKGDPGCNPKTEPINNSFLQQYGILEFKSKLSTDEFSKLSITERYNYNFDSFGMERQVVPEKFKGGNPYFK